MDGVAAPIAQVGIAEKGYLSIELAATGQGGHSSMVPKKTAIGVLATAISKLEEYEFPPRISGASEMMFSYLAPEMPFPRKFALSNLWLLRPVLAQQLSQAVVTNALISTTFATTVINGGLKDNVLPVAAKATANIRIIPGDTVQGTLETIEEIIDDPRVEIQVTGHLAIDSQQMLSSPDRWGYKMIEKTIRQLYPEVLVLPSQLTAVTDTRNYQELTENLYRFQPTWISSTADARRVHGIDERTSVENLGEFVQFYRQLILNSASAN
jgi:carboxypeptidase PM20D1